MTGDRDRPRAVLVALVVVGALGMVAFWVGIVWNIVQTGSRGGPALCALLGLGVTAVAVGLHRVIGGAHPRSAAEEEHDLHRFDNARD